MRILMLTQWFEPEPTFKGLLFAKELQRLGHEVEVLTGFPNYPGGNVYAGYKIRPWMREVMDGVPVLRVALYPSHDRSPIRRALNYLSFAAAASAAMPVLRRPDVAYVYHPPATIALPALLLRAMRGVPVVYDVQDLWPDTLAATGMVTSSRALRFVGRAMDAVYRRVDEIVVLSEGFRERLIARGMERTKVTVIHNWNAEDQIESGDVSGTLRTQLGLEGKFIVAFAGTMGRAQALETVLDTAELAHHDPRVHFVLVGAGTEAASLRKEAERRALDNVTFLTRRPASEIGQVLSMADALLVHLKSDPLFEITVPSKTQAYLMSGRPILMGVRGDAARIVQAAEAGVAFEPENPASLLAAIERLRGSSDDQLNAMGERGRGYYAERLSLRAGAGRFNVVLTRAARATYRYRRTKRAMDIAGASVSLVLGAIPMAVIALLARLRLGTPVIFRQTRPGRGGVPFTLLKFRTMTDERNGDGELLPDSERLTAFGAFLRKSSLDELPELWNVLRGDMSLVGPRPLLMRYTDFFTESEARRLDVPPGITGLAQVNGRNTTFWNERLALDTWYVEHLSPLLDVQILLRTFGQVLQRQGVEVDPESVMRNLDDERRSKLTYGEPR